MTKEVTATRAGWRGKRDLSNGLSYLWLSILLLALLGVLVAASSKASVIWMLAWPAPLILIFTAARFIREGYHKRDGVLVLGRRAPSPPLDLSAGPDDDVAQDDANLRVEVPIATGDPSSVVASSGRNQLAKVIDLATLLGSSDPRLASIRRIGDKESIPPTCMDPCSTLVEHRALN